MIPRSTAATLAGAFSFLFIVNATPYAAAICMDTQPVVLSAADQARLADNCPFGMPIRKGELVATATTHLVCRDGYVLEHHDVDRIPLWVSEHVTSAEVGGDVRRDREPFAADPLLPQIARAELSDYRNSGYDRGHMAPAGNQNSDVRLKEETFFLSNMCPQIGIGFNRAIWSDLEEKTRQWTQNAADNGEIWIITGPVFYDPKEEDPATADGLIEYDVIGANEVAVPTHFYKIVVGKTGGTLRATAFVLENRKHPRGEDLAQFVKPIDWIEFQTGLDFLPQLEDSQEEGLERVPGTMW